RCPTSVVCQVSSVSMAPDSSVTATMPAARIASSLRSCAGSARSMIWRTSSGLASPSTDVPTTAIPTRRPRCQYGANERATRVSVARRIGGLRSSCAGDIRLFKGWDAAAQLTIASAKVKPISPLRAKVKPISLFAQPVARLEPVAERSLGRVGREPGVVLPAGERRQRHQDRLGAPVGLEAERGAAVVEQVELDVAAAAQELELPLAIAVRVGAAAARDRQVRVEERLARVAHEREVALGIAHELIEEQPAHAARLAAVREVEVLVAPFLEARVELGVVAIAHRLPAAVEVHDVFAHGIVGREIGAAAEPQRAAEIGRAS